MTGFGKAEKIFSNKKIIVEIKTLNSKNLNLNIKAPDIYNEKEYSVKKIVAEKLIRGKINIEIKTESEQDIAVSLNKKAIQSYYKQLKEIAESFGHDPKSELLFQSVLRLPETLNTKESELSEEEWKVLEQTIEEAIIRTDEFRKQEGDSIAEDLRTKISNIQTGITEIENYEDERIEIVKERLNKKLAQINLPENSNERFEQEIIYYLEKFDINEEKQRLTNHCLYFLETMKTEAAGKKLNFISQEIGREINTTGSKANHHQIQRIVVEMKDNLEQIKEQLLNII